MTMIQYIGQNIQNFHMNNHSVETTIKLNRFKPRSYQIPIMDAIENKNYKRVLAIWPRRAGKDMVAWWICIRACIRKIGVYYYVFPTFAQGRRVIWDSVTSDGRRILDFIPEELVESRNSQTMSIRFKNGSLLQLVGSDNVDALMGTNMLGAVFSEYALQDPRGYQFLRPILTNNDGWAIFLSTPRGHNHLYEMYNIALHSKEWYCSKLTLDDTKHVSLEAIDRERQEGMASEDLIQQEWWTSFSAGVEGSYYCKYIDRMRIRGQIGNVLYEHGFKVHTSWDIGVRDSTTILWFQTIGQTTRIIDSYENSKLGLEHYIKILKEKPYIYGTHIAPHDIAVKEFGSGMSRIEKARQLGVKFTVAPGISIEDGIECVRSCFSRLWIDETSCKQFIKAIENYRQEWDHKKKIYRSNPLHDWSSHWADNLRYLAITLPKTRDGLSSQELDKRHSEAVYGSQSNMPAIFRDDLPKY